MNELTVKKLKSANDFGLILWRDEVTRASDIDRPQNHRVHPGVWPAEVHRGAKPETEEDSVQPDLPFDRALRSFFK